MALTHLDAPLHHGRASRLLERMLASHPDDLTLLTCRGHITAAAEVWAESFAAFDRVWRLATDPRQVLDAREERAWALLHTGESETAETELQTVIIERTSSEQAAPLGRAYWRLGRCYWLRGGRWRTDEAYAYGAFTTAARLDPSLAPAFTSLGVFFSEVPVPPDRVQAARCLQRAFELDPTQDEAARLLVSDFAADRQWDLVELIARRVLAGHAGTSGRAIERAAVGSRHARKLAWAWQAVGSAELVRLPEIGLTHAGGQSLRCGNRGVPARFARPANRCRHVRAARQCVRARRQAHRGSEITSFASSLSTLS